jgi:PKD repeat protein
MPTTRNPRSRNTIVTFVVALGLVATVATPAWAAPPDDATLVAPANGSTSTTAAPLLRVAASDPDGGQLQVTFQGRKAGATVPGTPADPFTIVAIPDTQNYTYLNRQGTITQQTQWAVSTRSALNTAFVVQLGDLVSEYDNLTQWGYTSTGFSVLDNAGLPNAVVPGNHDFNNATGAITPYDDYFPTTRYSAASWTPSSTVYGGYLGQNQFGPDPIDRRNFDNYSLFTAGGQDFLVLGLEWEAPQYALDWADRVIAAHPTRTVIMFTHSFVNIDGTRRTTAQRPGGTPAATLWSTFVATHCSIKLVLSGHEHNGNAGEARRTDNNTCGQPVQQIMTDYQDRPNGGDGWLRYYTFNPAAGTVTATTYSPKLGTFETDADSAFTIPFPLGTQVPAPFAPIATATVASGATAQTSWAGLDPDTLYEWRATVSDGSTTTTSPTWTVRTPAQVGIVDDTFTRTLASSWGTADSGQAWTLSSTSSAYSVDGNRGRMTLPAGTGRAARLTTVSLADVAIAADVAVTPSPTGSGTYVALMSRLNGNNSYRAKLQFAAGGVITLIITRVAGSTETNLGWLRVPGTFTTGQSVHLAFESVGASPTTLRAKVWPTGGAEPASWLVSVTDGTAGYQAAAAVGIDCYQSGSATATATVSLDRFTATPVGTPPPPPPNVAPVAAIGTPTVAGRAVTVSGAGSTDSDGTITGYAWNFGDGTTASGPTASRTYAADGTYTITLTVTDDDLATGTTTRSVTVAAAPPPNAPPVAVIATPTILGRAVTVSGAGSTDSDGTVASYNWNFGDGTTASGPNATRTYAADGTYPITLTVTDDDLATGTATRSVTVAAPPPPPGELVRDDFGRTWNAGWGSADAGGTWTFGASASRYAVAGGVGQHLLTSPGTNADTMITTATSASAELRASLSWSRTGEAGRLYASFVPRAITTTTDYRLRIAVASDGKPLLVLVRTVGGVETQLANTTLSTVTVAAGSWYSVAVRAVPSGGSTVLSVKFWPRGTTEPASWQLTATDATAALQAPGWARFNSYESGSATAPITTSFDDVRFQSVTP